MNLSLSVFLFADNKLAVEDVLKESIEEEGDFKICGLLIEKLCNLKRSKGRNKNDDEYAGWLNLGVLGKLHIFTLRLKNSNILMDH
jgi:hypothetical protein